MSKIPERVSFAIDVLGATAGERIAEIGCGTGLALAELLNSAEVWAYGVDRSEHAVRQARKLNAAAIASGRLEVVRRDLASAPAKPFDRVFAVNVNIFWRDPKTAFASAREWVAPDGVLLLVFDAPSPDKLSKIMQTLTASAEPFALDERHRASKASLGAIRFRRAVQ